MYIYIYTTICNVGLTKRNLCANLRADITLKDRQDRRKREKQNHRGMFYRGGTTIGAGMLCHRWLSFVDVVSGITLILLLIGLWALILPRHITAGGAATRHPAGPTGLRALAKRYLVSSVNG